MDNKPLAVLFVGTILFTAQAASPGDDVISSRYAVALLGQHLADIEKSIAGARASGSITPIYGAIRRFGADPLWTIVENPSANPEEQDTARAKLSKTSATIMAEMRQIEKLAYAELDSEWIRANFVLVTKRQLTWNSYQKNWSLTPNQYGIELRKRFLSDLEAQRIRIVRLKRLAERNNGDASDVEMLIARSNEIATSDAWVEFLSPNRDVVVRTVNGFTEQIRALSDAIDAQWMGLHPELVALRDRIRQEMIVSQGIVKAESAAQQALERSERLAADLDSIQSSVESEREEAKRRNRRLSNRIDDLQNQIDNASRTGHFTSW